MFPTEDSLYLLTDAAMALKVDPETLDTTDEVRKKVCKKCQKVVNKSHHSKMQKDGYNNNKFLFFLSKHGILI